MKFLTFDDVRACAREFQDLHETTMYGAPAVKLGNRLVACVPSHRSAEPESLAVRTDFEQRAALLEDDPETYYLKEHYANHPVVLVRMARLRRDQLQELIAAGRRCVLAGEARKKKPGRLKPAAG